MFKNKIKCVMKRKKNLKNIGEFIELSMVFKEQKTWKKLKII